MRITSILRTIFVSTLAISAVTFAAALQSQEIQSTVPELNAFHDVIYPIWHTAYPEKDYAALRRYAPEVKSLAEKVFAAELPPILHEKKKKWDRGLAEFKKAVEEYLAAASGTDDQALLAAAEELHSKYELMVRIIRPVLREVDAFHKVLYVIYHKDLPEKNYDGIRSVSEDLALKAEAIAKATLPKRLEAKAEEFRAAAEALQASTKNLNAALTSGDPKAIDAAVETVHTQYQKLERIFD